MPPFTPQLLDLRHSHATGVFPSKRSKDGREIRTSLVKAGKTVVRAPATVTGITIHQTACVFGPANDRTKAHRRALNVPAHVTAFRDGVYVAAAPLGWYLYHGNDLNLDTLGLECEGHYPGLSDDPRTPRREDIATTWGGKPTPLDATALETFRAALRWLVETGRASGMPIRNVYAHRQANGSKPSDPGEELWRKLVVEFGVPQLGLVPEPDRTWRDGRPIPAQWQPGAQGKY